MKSHKSLKKELDRVFSLFIRRKSSDWRGNVWCYTCGKVAHYQKMQCGHYIKRSHLATRWLEDNARVQCVGCNVFQNGNYPKFTERLLREVGVKKFEQLLKRQHELKQWTDKELAEEIDKYETKLLAL